MTRNQPNTLNLTRVESALVSLEVWAEIVRLVSLSILFPTFKVKV